MWLPQRVIAEVDHLARIHYIDQAQTKLWNSHKKAGELRLLTGWCWSAKDGSRYRQGFKTMTVAYRDAWYVLVQETEAPIARRRLRVVRRAA